MRAFSVTLIEYKVYKSLCILELEAWDNYGKLKIILPDLHPQPLMFPGTLGHVDMVGRQYLFFTEMGI